MGFKAFVLTDVASTDQIPEIAISLYIQEFFLRESAGSGSGRRGARQSISSARNLRGIFTTERFRLRLEALRDVSHEVAGRDEPWGIKGDLDPWSIHEGVPRLKETDTRRRRSVEFEPELPGARTLTHQGWERDLDLAFDTLDDQCTE